MNLLLPPDCAPEARHLLGISGGRDSVALLEALWEAGYRNLVLCHLNHRLRGAASDADARQSLRTVSGAGLSMARSSAICGVRTFANDAKG